MHPSPWAWYCPFSFCRGSQTCGPVLSPLSLSAAALVLPVRENFQLSMVSEIIFEFPIGRSKTKMTIKMEVGFVFLWGRRVEKEVLDRDVSIQRTGSHFFYVFFTHPLSIKVSDIFNWNHYLQSYLSPPGHVPSSPALGHDKEAHSARGDTWWLPHSWAFHPAARWQREDKKINDSI